MGKTEAKTRVVATTAPGAKGLGMSWIRLLFRYVLDLGFINVELLRACLAFRVPISM